MEFHEAANIFPLDEENLGDLAADIRLHGQQVAIETFDGKILDGRRRWLACQKVGISPVTRAVTTSDPVAYVKTLNLYRRHLTPGQLAMCAAKAAKLNEKYKAESLARRTEAASRGGKASGATRRGDAKVPVNLPEPSSGDTRDQVGKDFGVSGKYVDYATKVIDNAIPEVVKAVEEGRMALPTAVILSTEPEEEQLKEATAPKRKRNYKSVSSPRDPEEEKQEEPPEEKTNGEIKERGVGVIRAHEAINCLTRIPKNDASRKRGFQIVKDWIRKNP
jgi:hypothetical protein